MIIPIAQAFNEYANTVNKQLWDNGFYSDVDSSDMTLNKKVRNAQLLQYNYILIVGQDEQDQQAVNVRSRDDESKKSRGEVVKFADFLKTAKDLVESKK